MKSLDKKKQLLIKTKKDKISSKRQCESCQHMGKGECNAFKCIARNYCDWEEIKRPKFNQAHWNYPDETETIIIGEPKELSMIHKQFSVLSNKKSETQTKELEWIKDWKQLNPNWTEVQISFIGSLLQDLEETIRKQECNRILNLECLKEEEELKENLFNPSLAQSVGLTSDEFLKEMNKMFKYKNQLREEIIDEIKKL